MTDTPLHRPHKKSEGDVEQEAGEPSNNSSKQSLSVSDTSELVISMTTGKADEPD